MKVRLWTDAPMANIALMKIARFHRDRGDDVDFHNPMFDQDTDILYQSKLFKFTPDYEYSGTARVVKGGTGYHIATTLPDGIDCLEPDYSIYHCCDYSMQFFSRGCVRKCPFCVVREKEGYIRSVEPMRLNPCGTRIEVMDNNFFANPSWRKSVYHILDCNQPINLHGVDVRMLTEEHAKILNKFPHYKQIHVAWDNPRTDIAKHILRMIKHVPAYKVMCYVLIGFWSSPEDDLYRVEKLRELGVDPFVMPFDKSDPYQRRFARWVNHKAVFKSVKWNDYGRRVDTSVSPVFAENEQLGENEANSNQ